MTKKRSFNPGFSNENLDTESEIMKDLGAVVNNDDLSYNEEDDSFELDVESTDEDYDHPDPYKTSVKKAATLILILTKPI